MRKIIVATFTSLDGVMQAPGGPQEDPTGVIVANYYPDGAVKTGDFQLAEPSEAELERRRNLT